ncbi:MAG: hypothetical protein ACRDT8_11285 [Micromonosporaceae bacterium]
MIGRLLWIGVGVAAGVVVYRKLTRAAESYSPRGLASSAQKTAVGALESVREFVADVKEAMAEREEEIHLALLENVESGHGTEWGAGSFRGPGGDDVPDWPDLGQPPR